MQQDTDTEVEQSDADVEAEWLTESQVNDLYGTPHSIAPMLVIRGVISRRRNPKTKRWEYNARQVHRYIESLRAHETVLRELRAENSWSSGDAEH